MDPMTPEVDLPDEDLLAMWDEATPVDRPSTATNTGIVSSVVNNRWFGQHSTLYRPDAVYKDQPATSAR
jgi:hypothetical protein